jgi:hypothetical protein
MADSQRFPGFYNSIEALAKLLNPPLPGGKGGVLQEPLYILNSISPLLRSVATPLLNPATSVRFNLHNRQI